MSAENKKLLWIVIAVVAVVLVVAVVGVVVFYPKQGAAKAPATAGAVAAPKAQDPQDYLASPALEPQAGAPTSKDGDVIVIYGDKPQGLASGTADGAAAIAATAGGAIDPTKPALGPEGKPLVDPGQGAGAGSVATTTPATAKTATTTKPAASKPATTATKTLTPAKPTAKAPTDEYWIQAASFTSRAKAEELKDSLSKKGLAALVTLKEIAGKNWYRVRIGPYASNAEASGWLTKVKTIPGCAEAGIWKGAK